MNKITIITKTESYVKETLGEESSGHDWWHVYRVWQMAKHIGEKETADMFIIEIGALLHDIADHKFHGGDEEIGPKTARNWLKSLQVANADIDQVCNIIRHMSFKGAKVKSQISTIEGKIIQDADRLDAIGAIGIARTFAYGGFRGREMYNPNIKPVMHNSFEEYRKSTGPTINHFYEKLLLLKDLMNTKTAKQIAIERTQYLEAYLQKFYNEWEGKE